MTPSSTSSRAPRSEQRNSSSRRQNLAPPRQSLAELDDRRNRGHDALPESSNARRNRDVADLDTRRQHRQQLGPEHPQVSSTRPISMPIDPDQEEDLGGDADFGDHWDGGFDEPPTEDPYMDWQDFHLPGHLDMSDVDESGEHENRPTLTPEQHELLNDLDDVDCEDLMETICAELDAKKQMEIYKEIAEGGYVITDDMLDALSFANWKVKHHSSRMSYNHLRWILRNKLEMHSEYKIFKVLTETSGVEAQVFHCCVNTCVCFVGPHAGLTRCPICKEARYHANSQKPRNRFLYYPLIPRLQAYFTDTPLAHNIRTYRDKWNRPEHFPNPSFRDIFDGKHYQSLLQEEVWVVDQDGKKKSFGHKHFSDFRDIAWGLGSDSYQLFKKS